MPVVHALIVAAALVVPVASRGVNDPVCDELVRPAPACLVDDPAACQAIELVVEYHCERAPAAPPAERL